MRLTWRSWMMRTSRKPDPFTRRLRSNFLERAASFCPYCAEGKAPLRVILFADGLELAEHPSVDDGPDHPHEWRHPRLASGGVVSWVVCTADGTWEQFENVRRDTRCLADGPIN